MGFWRACSTLVLVLAYIPVISITSSARPATWSGMSESQARSKQASAGVRQKLGPRRGYQGIRTTGPISIQTLGRGNLYAVNVLTETFKLVQVDLAALRPQQLATPEALSAQLRESYPGENVGWAWYADTYSEDGWYRLEIRIDEDAPFPDVVKARATGFVEGNLQGKHMYRYWTNYRTNEYRGMGEAPSQELYDFFDEQYDWMTKRVESATGWTLATLRGGAAADGRGWMPDDETAADSADRRYWALVGLVAAQFEGLAAGFWASVVNPSYNMTWHELYTLNSMGDLYDLNVLFPPKPPSTAAEPLLGPDGSIVRQRRYSPGHGEVGEYGYGEQLDCSAIIKLQEQPDDGDGGDDDDPGSGGGDDDDPHDLPNGAEVVGGGAVAVGRDDGRRMSGSGAAVRRAEKGAGAGKLRSGGGVVQRRRARNFWAAHNTWRPYYDMVRTWKVYDLPWAATGPLTISSSPGLLSSKDDWYTTDTFVVMETTNGIYNKALFDLIQPKCVLMWQRVQVANFGARYGTEWVDVFARHNSGTYNNQWMVLDVPQLEAGYRSDVLWVLEQVPGRVVSKDVSRVLFDQGYWASYNVPYFPEIYNLTGYPYPSIYDTCPRARIFSREQARVASRSDLMSLMRLNRYTDDPLSAGLPNNAIAARYDLPAAPDASGQPRNFTRRPYGAVDAKVVDLDSFRSRRTYVINGPTADEQPVFSWSAEPLFEATHRDGCVDKFDFGWQAFQSVIGPGQPQEQRAETGAGEVAAAV